MTRLSSLMPSGLLFAGAATAMISRLTVKKFFDPTRLIQVELKVKLDDWDRMRKQHRLLVKTLRTAPADGSGETVRLRAGAVDRRREGRTGGDPEKGFVGSLDEPAVVKNPDRPLRQRNVRRGRYAHAEQQSADGSRVHQLIGYQLFRDAGLQASYCNLAHVTVNGKSLGYIPTSSHSTSTCFGVFDSAKGTLYEGTAQIFGRRCWFVSSASSAPYGSGKFFAGRRRPEVWRRKTAQGTGRYVDMDRFTSFGRWRCWLGIGTGMSATGIIILSILTPSQTGCTSRRGVTNWPPTGTCFGIDHLNCRMVKADSPFRVGCINSEGRKYFDAMRLLLKKAWNEKSCLRRSMNCRS